MNNILNVSRVSKVEARQGYFCSVHGLASKVMQCQTHRIASSLIRKLGAAGLNLCYTRVSLMGKNKQTNKKQTVQTNKLTLLVESSGISRSKTSQAIPMCKQNGKPLVQSAGSRMGQDAVIAEAEKMETRCSKASYSGTNCLESILSRSLADDASVLHSSHRCPSPFTCVRVVLRPANCCHL